MKFKCVYDGNFLMEPKKCVFLCMCKFSFSKSFQYSIRFGEAKRKKIKTMCEIVKYIDRVMGVEKVCGWGRWKIYFVT